MPAGTTPATIVPCPRLRHAVAETTAASGGALIPRRRPRRRTATANAFAPDPCPDPVGDDAPCCIVHDALAPAGTAFAMDVPRKIITSSRHSKGEGNEQVPFLLRRPRPGCGTDVHPGPAAGPSSPGAGTRQGGAPGPRDATGR